MAGLCAGVTVYTDEWDRAMRGGFSPSFGIDSTETQSTR